MLSPPPPPLVPASEAMAGPSRVMSQNTAPPFSWREAGYVGLGVGVAAAVAGVTALAFEPTYRRSESGSVYVSDLPLFRTALTLARVGAGLLISGLLVAAAGAGMVLFGAPATPRAVRASVVAWPGGAACAVVWGF